MPIQIVEAPEPLTAASAYEPPLLIDSDATRSLMHELRRYCDQQIAGRSFLIAGHRGAGKTTSLLGAFQQVASAIQAEAADLVFRRQSRQPAASRPTLQPLLVLLQGPNLLPPVQPAAEKPSAASGVASTSPLVTISVGSANAPDSASDSPGKSPPTPVETVLIQITLALYRSLAEEFTQAYRAKAYRNFRNFRTPAEARKFRQVLETAARLELELDECEGVALLRQYWRFAGALETGLLDVESPAATFTPDQGYRELIALASACDAYRRICGKVTRSDEKTNRAESERETKLAVTAKGSEFSRAVTSLLTGGAVTSAVLAAKNSVATAILAGLLSALASTIVFKVSSSRSRKQDSKRSDLFIPDLTVATLDRLLPLLIQRIRRAGLSPIFMVDELDKVEDPSRIDDTLKVLKKLVAEKAFFCFLTDRSYFEELTQKLSDAPYVIESTFYSHRIFIVFRHQDLHAWLEKTLKLTEPPNSEDAADLLLLPYIILHAARMHPIDVRRQLLAFSNAAAEFKYPQGAIRSRARFRFELSIQVAIELTLEDPAISNEIDRRPELLQLTHDALYYISRQWHAAPDRLILSDGAGRRAFETYLCKRKSSSAPKSPASPGKTGPDDPKPPGADAAPEVLTEDPSIGNLMFESVQAVAALLAAPESLKDAGKQAGRPQQVLDALSAVPLLHPVPGEPGVYSWHAYPSGDDVEEKDAAKAAEADRAFEGEESPERGLIDFILGFDKVLAGLTDSHVNPSILSTALGVLPTTPAWSDVRPSMQRLDYAKKDPAYSGREADIAVLQEYAKVLKRYATATAVALAFGKALGSFQPDQPLFGYELLASALRFPQVEGAEVRMKLDKLAAQIPVRPDGSRWILLPPPISDDQGESLQVWRKWVETAADALQTALQSMETNSPAVVRIAWEYWEQRFRVSTALDPELSTILCHARGSGPGRALRFDLTTMLIWDWSTLFLASFNPRQPDEEPVPAWTTEVALEQLGFDQQRRNQFAISFSISRSMPQSMPQSIPPSSAPAPLAAVVLSNKEAGAGLWQPDPAAPILWLNPMGIADKGFAFSPELVTPLQFDFVAFDRSGTLLTPTGAGVVNPLTSIGQADLEFADALLPKGPSIPIIVDSKPLISAHPRFFFVAANSPRQLFAAVRDSPVTPSA